MTRVFKSKKAFTLIEIIVTVAIMAVLVGFAVPNVDKAVEKRERYSAEADTQEIFRQAINAVVDLRDSGVTPNFGLGNGTFDQNFAKTLVKKLYDTIVVMDIALVYLDTSKISDGTGTDQLATNYEGCGQPSTRTKILTGGNKKPYVVVSVRINGTSSNNKTAKLTVSYHNAKNPYLHTTSASEAVGTFDTASAYATNNNTPIYYTYTIRK